MTMNKEEGLQDFELRYVEETINRLKKIQVNENRNRELKVENTQDIAKVITALRFKQEDYDIADYRWSEILAKKIYEIRRPFKVKEWTSIQVVPLRDKLYKIAAVCMAWIDVIERKEKYPWIDER